MDQGLATFLRDRETPDVPGSAWVDPPPPAARRVALISSAGLKLPGDRPFSEGSNDYRVIPAERARDVVMDHVSVSHDRTGFHHDVNIVFPLARLQELADGGVIGSVADFHYSFMGATDPNEMEAHARQLAGVMKADGVNTVVLTPV
ncbi:MAG: selenoprotein B glycine/betaine/sarcosine/D-proline reductase [Rhodospirillales bacterium]|nr:selenoprotein B glycine/betaine/sarcosine/D-proline reductase [Rhodospirillales bacterium]